MEEGKIVTLSAIDFNDKEILECVTRALHVLRRKVREKKNQESILHSHGDVLECSRTEAPSEQRYDN